MNERDVPKDLIDLAMSVLADKNLQATFGLPADYLTHQRGYQA